MCLLRVSVLALLLALVWVGGITSAAADIDERLDELLAPWQGTDSPGLVVAAWQDGRVLFERAYGTANLEHDVPIRVDTRFNAGSVAKMFTAYAILRLETEGRLSLDDPLGRHLDGLPDHLAAVTLRQLLQHTGGVKDDWTLATLAGWEPGDVLTHDHARRLILRQDGLDFEPGAAYSYSNSGYLLLADVIARISGDTHAVWFEREIFGPLGMTGTLIPDHPRQLIPRLATPYEVRRAGRGRDNLERGSVQSDVQGAGNLITTTRDLLRWAEFLLGDARVLGRLAEQAEIGNGMATGYGLGMQVGRLGGESMLHHGGAVSGYRSHLLLVPEHGLAVAVLANVNTLRPAAIGSEVAGMLSAPHAAESVADPGPTARTNVEPLRHAALEEAARYRGRYLLETGRTLRVEAAEGRLFLVMGGSVRSLQPLDAGRFELMGEGAEVSFEGRNGGIDRLTMRLPGQALAADRIEATPVAGWDFRLYAGRYYSPALDAHYELVRTGDTLVARRSRGSDLAFTPIGDDRFLEWDPGDLMLEFQRNRRGRVTGFLLSTSRARNVAFERQ